jgi:hypothetical protein
VLRLKAGGRERFGLVSADVEHLVASNCSLKEAQAHDKQLHLLFARLFVNQLRKKPMGNPDEFASEVGTRAKDCSRALWEAYKQGVPLRLCTPPPAARARSCVCAYARVCVCVRAHARARAACMHVVHTRSRTHKRDPRVFSFSRTRLAAAAQATARTWLRWRR